MNDQQPVHEVFMTWLTKWITYVGGFGSAGLSTVFAWLGTSQAVAIVGIFVGVGGFLVNIFFNWRRDRREERREAARIAISRVAVPDTNY